MESTSKYNKILPTKMSSTTLLTIYLLYVLKKEDSPVYGNEILKTIEQSLGDAWNPSHGTLYPLLGDLEENDLIKVIGSDNKRKFYMITPKGSKMLEELLEEYRPLILSSKDFFERLIENLYGGVVDEG